MGQLELAKAKVAVALQTSASPAVLCSFGKDSLLLLSLVREVRPNTPIIWFRTGLPEGFGKRMIRLWNLEAYRWHPADVYLLAEHGRRTLVQEFGFAGDRLPLLTDLNGSDGPHAEQLFALRTPTVYAPFDTLLVGWKDSDTHWVKGDGKLAEDGFTLGNSRVYAPLRHLSDEAVRAAIIDRRIPFEPTPDELTLCTHCISTLPLGEFRSKYNITEEATDGCDIRG